VDTLLPYITDMHFQSYKKKERKEEKSKETRKNHRKKPNHHNPTNPNHNLSFFLLPFHGVWYHTWLKNGVLFIM